SLVELGARNDRSGLCLVDLTSLCGLAELAHGGLQRRLHGLVALVGGVVLPVALDLGLDVRHFRLASSVRFRWGTSGSGASGQGSRHEGKRYQRAWCRPNRRVVSARVGKGCA